MFDPMLKMLADQFGDDWVPFILAQIGLPPDTVAVSLDSNLPAVSLEADRIFRVETEPPFLLHFEFESSRPPDRAARFLKYNVLASEREGLPTRTVVVLLRSEAQSPDLTGDYVRGAPGRPEYLVFRYDIIRLWQIPPRVLLDGGPGLWPLVPLANLNESQVPVVLEEVYDHWNRVPIEVALELFNATEILMGLRYSEEFIDHVLRRLATMEDSVTYQRIIRRGEERGRVLGREEGKIEMAWKLLIQLLETKFGPVSEEIITEIQEIHDLERLAKMNKSIFAVNSPAAIMEVE